MTELDIHAPSVPQTDLSDATTDQPVTMEAVMALIKKKDEVEAELKALGAVLDSHKVTMDTSLTTFDGYPRDDIDIAQSIPSPMAHRPPHISF